MLFVGDKGKILCDFRANKPRLIPQSRQKAFEGSIVDPDFDTTTAEDEWINAIKNGTKSQGSFEQVARAGRGGHARQHRAARALQAAAVGRARRWSSRIPPEANKFVRREQYRPGWEKIIG